MTQRARGYDRPTAPGEELEPEILAIIQALARANARRDYAAAQRAAGRTESKAL
ncbi:hypothetical protein [Caulobacter sp. BP25]|uniref:hypothetical protein n=1 Tax=Caulobacter sp. BP25 TaxID=2048900 RepID=UPI0013747340|nr:hypothetical protein [Caulobacter sp. BP25]